MIGRATYAMSQFFEAVGTLELARDRIDAEGSFDEFNLDVDLRYDGVLMEFSQQCPTEADLVSDETEVTKLAGFLIRNYVDRITSECAAFHAREHLPLRSPMAFQPIDDKHAREVLTPFEQLAEEFLRGPLVAAALHQDIQHMSVLIHGPSEIVALTMPGGKASSRCHLSPD